jgi:hypothetical protein
MSLSVTYCDVTLESQNSSLLSNGDKQVLAEMYTHAAVEELCNGEVNTPL